MGGYTSETYSFTTPPAGEQIFVRLRGFGGTTLDGCAIHTVRLETDSTLIPRNEAVAVSNLQDEIYLSPNPSLGKHTTVLHFPKSFTEEGLPDIRLINIHGQAIPLQINSLSSNRMEISVTNPVQSGIYLVEIKFEGKRIVKKWLAHD